MQLLDVATARKWTTRRQWRSQNEIGITGGSGWSGILQVKEGLGGGGGGTPENFLKLKVKTVF